MRALRAALLWVAASAAPAGAASDRPPVDLAYGAYQRGLYLTAFKEAAIRVRQNPNDAAAMTLLGELFNQGLGVRENPKEAAGWYRLAATHGDRSAMATLGLMAADGRGMPADRKQARDWFERAAAAREPTACFNLAQLLMSSGNEADQAQAASLLKTAAAAELADAQHALGVLYAKGMAGLTADPAEAARLYERASRNGSVAGTVEYAIAQFNGVGTPKDEAAAARRFRRAAAQGNAIAQNRLARLYVLGKGVPRNLVEAAAWHLVASGQGLADSWLDDAVRSLQPAERALSEKLAAERSGRL